MKQISTVISGSSEDTVAIGTVMIPLHHIMHTVCMIVLRVPGTRYSEYGVCITYTCRHIYFTGPAHRHKILPSDRKPATLATCACETREEGRRIQNLVTRYIIVTRMTVSPVWRAVWILLLLVAFRVEDVMGYLSNRPLVGVKRTKTPTSWSHHRPSPIRKREM